jgi:hypothetical protein
MFFELFGLTLLADKQHRCLQVVVFEANTHFVAPVAAANFDDGEVVHERDLTIVTK